MITAWGTTKIQPETVEIDKLKLLRKSGWIDVRDPSEEELEALAGETGILVKDLKGCIDPNERPRLQERKTYVMVIFRAPFLENGRPKAGAEISTTPIGFILSKNYLLTVHLEKIESFASVHTQEAELSQLLKQGPEHLLAAFLFEIIRHFALVLDDISEDVDHLEDRMVRVAAEENVAHVFRTKKTLLYFRKALIANRDVITLLEKSEFTQVNSLFRDLYIELMQLIDISEIFRETLTNAIEIHLSAVSTKLNEVMKMFAVIAFLLLLPTLISGIYGMNFAVLPLSQHPQGFWMILGLMVLTILLTLTIFRYKEWV